MSGLAGRWVDGSGKKHFVYSFESLSAWYISCMFILVGIKDS
jgi:hypothetical protein